MKLSADDLTKLSKLAIAAAESAAHVIREHTGQEIIPQHKRGGESLASQVVTEVDLLAQKSILETLEPFFGTYDLGLLTEELADDRSRFDKDYFWCIDPLDGTLPFIESTPGYAVSIALVSRSGESQIGVVCDPISMTCYHAVIGQGAFRNGVSWQLDQTPGKTLTFIMDRSFVQHQDYAEVYSAMEWGAKESGYSSLKTIQHGGAAMNACWVLENAPACYFKFPKKSDGGGSLWDYAATACLFSEIGAHASDIHGVPLDLNQADSAFMNHRGILYASTTELAEKVQGIYSRLAANG